MAQLTISKAELNKLTVAGLRLAAGMTYSCDTLTLTESKVGQKDTEFLTARVTGLADEFRILKGVELGILQAAIDSGCVHVGMYDSKTSTYTFFENKAFVMITKPSLNSKGYADVDLQASATATVEVYKEDSAPAKKKTAKAG